MKKLIASVIVIAVSVAIAVCGRIYLKNMAEEMISYIEEIEKDPENGQKEAGILFEKFAESRKILSFSVHGELLSEIDGKFVEMQKLYAIGADAEKLRECLSETEILLGKLYSENVISPETVF